MKTILILFMLIGVIFLVRCTTQRRVEYIVPEEYQGATRDNLVRMLEEGQKLYKIHCSGCHGIFGNGKDSIPNFTRTQIEAYRTAALLDDPKNHAVAQRVRIEDLDRILQFLTFRKQRG